MKYRITMLVGYPGVIVTEFLRYAGLVSISGIEHTGHLPIAIAGRFNCRQDDVLVTIECPRGLLPIMWCRQNVDRIASFGVLAMAWSESKRGINIVYQR